MENLMTFLESIPENTIAVTVYLLGSLIILWCWYEIAKRLPHPLGGVSWIVVFAILLTPTISEGHNAGIAPATFGLLFGVLTKEMPLVWSNLSAILMVIGLGLVVGYFWSKYSPRKAGLAAKNNSTAL
ncbi:hypothetical protein HXZ79_12020 [Acinetobacter indicus]|uniref:hypothetical protein n=1 Tax=Acinetobacter indicus TaxID=756892 RepID=UPI00257856DB|nr:hypothetical protein [Acinetobacter indicus]MDM1311966.1 hypothetical protein [Acinetobacter indicus]